MKELTQYLNGLTKPEQMAFALRCGTTVGYLRKACSAGELLREKLCVRVERHSAGAVTRINLRPEDWMEIWPELRNTTTTTIMENCQELVFLSDEMQPLSRDDLKANALMLRRQILGEGGQ